MRKQISLILMALMLLAAGCENNNNAATTPAEESKQTETATVRETTPEQTTPEPVTTPEPTTPEPTTPEPTTPEPTTEVPTIAGGYAVNDIVTLGHYGGEDIEWIVLAVEDGKALLLSRYGLDTIAYDDTDYDVVWERHKHVTWEECTLRAWLNKSFYETAFSESEQGMILLSYLENPDNPDYGTEGGNDTEDKIFCLSLDEVNKYCKTAGKRKCYPAKLAEEKGCSINDGYCIWWLRTPGITFEQNAAPHAACVYGSGQVSSHGAFIDGYPKDRFEGTVVETTVRPAFWYNPNP